MADFSLIKEDCFEEIDDDVFEPKNGSSGDASLPNQKAPKKIHPPYLALLLAKERGFRKPDTIITAILDQFTSAAPDALLEDFQKVMELVPRVVTSSMADDVPSIFQGIPALLFRAVEFSEVMTNNNCYDAAFNSLVPMLVQHIDHRLAQVRRASHNTLIVLIKEDLISKAKAEIQICPSLLAFTKNEDLLYFREFIILMLRMGRLLGKDVTERVFLKRFTELCTVDKSHIRKACAAKMGEFCNLVTEQTNERILFPLFFNLCEDSEWSVRKSCADAFVTISCICSPSIRTELLAPRFMKLLNDEDQHVQVSCFQGLGPFITTFAEPKIINIDYGTSGKLVLKNYAGHEYKVHSFCEEPPEDFRNLGREPRALRFRYYDPSCEYDDYKGDEDEDDEDEDDEDKDDEICDNNLKSDINTIKNETVNITMENNLQNVELSIGKIKLDKVEDNKSSDEGKYQENSDLYNSYYYWYVPPDKMPLDPNIVNDNNNEIISVNDEKLISKTLEESKPNHIGFMIESSVYGRKNSSDDLASIEKIKSQSVIPHFLLEHYIKMVYHDYYCSSYCAYAFPGVALTLGKENWEIIKDMLPMMANHRFSIVQDTVASFLHEIAIILGPEKSTEELAPLFVDFFTNDDEIKTGIVKHLVQFLKVINEDQRMLYLPKLKLFFQNHHEANWRVRYNLVDQMILAVELIPITSIHQVFLLGFGLLCVDNVAAVRQKSIELISIVIKMSIDNVEKTKKFLGRLTEKFAHSKKWKFRQIFVMCCKEILSIQAVEPKVFVGELMPHLLDLSWDPVANVRLSVSKTITQHMLKMPYFLTPENQHYDNLQTVLRRLQTDKDRDVRYFAQESTPADTTTSAE